MLKRFKIGGIHPHDNKLSKTAAIEVLPLAQKVVIPLSQHIGAPAKAIVKKGDTVKVGDMIAEAGGFVSAAVHSSVSGVVEKVDVITDNMGLSKMAVMIKVEGDEWNENIDRSPELKKECKLLKDEIIKKIAAAGIVGMGGATFPTQVKLSPPPGKVATALVINGVECEPYLTSDHRVMLEKSAEIMVGIDILCKAIGVGKAYVGIENNKPDAIQVMTAAAKDYPFIEVVPLRVQYPQGGEKQLIDAVMNRQVPSGALPIEVGAVVQNVGTALAVYEAVQKNKPLIERVVTVTGKSVKTPKNFLTRIGTPISQLIEAAGGLPENVSKVINGGPMMGRSCSNIEAPVTKGCSGILMMNDEESKRVEPKTCIRCAKCVSVCPMGLEPYLLATLSNRNMFAEQEEHKVTDCIECGSCSFTCPANLPLLDVIRLGKGEVMKIIRSRSAR
ncbi:MAG: electron transport complex subunit RsxC [Rikenellaceae bacterium]